MGGINQLTRGQKCCSRTSRCWRELAWQGACGERRQRSDHCDMGRDGPRRHESCLGGLQPRRGGRGSGSQDHFPVRCSDLCGISQEDWATAGSAGGTVDRWTWQYGQQPDNGRGVLVPREPPCGHRCSRYPSAVLTTSGGPHGADVRTGCSAYQQDVYVSLSSITKWS